jgi:alginate O-acetyltransferase complex protein AlgI
MVFSSYLFLFGFLPLALAIYYLTPRRAKQLTLALLSYIFYGWGNPLFCLLMLATTVVDYVAGRFLGEISPADSTVNSRLNKNRRRRLILLISIVCNLGSLGFFKYWNFGIESYNLLLGQLGLGNYAWESFFRVALPLGISFYTFQSLSYTIDVYRGNTKPLRSFIDFACYVAMFPQLVAGPIVRFRDVAEQLSNRTHTFEKFARGTAFFCVGLGKKVLLANPCGQIADAAYNASSVSAADAWVGMFAYSFQIYFDFSGYSDMAIGLGLMLGFIFAKNFDSPYQAKSITEFWQRWHISLSTWLRDYLYIPLGGNRLGYLRTNINLAIVMILGGIWHGAAWNFLIWGAIQGGWLIAERSLRGSVSFKVLPEWTRCGLTFLGVSLAFIFFRADNLQRAVEYVRSLIGLGVTEAQTGLVGSLIWQPFSITILVISAVIVWFCPQTWDWTKTLTIPKVIIALLLFWLSVAMLTVQDYNPFIYFIF